MPEELNLQGDVPIIKVYKRRWSILAIFVALSTLSSIQWVEYCIIGNIVMRYYHVSASAVNWSALSFSIAWPILVIPSSFIIDKRGLRVSALIGSFTTIIGAFVKVFSIGENLFIVVIVGQVIVAISQLFILSLPPKIAMTWFKPQEVSSVCSLGFFGLTLGCALGFLLPPILVRDSENLADIGYDLKRMCWALLVTISPVVLMVIFFFPAEPPHPPSQVMSEHRANRERLTLSGFMKSIKVLVTNKAFMMHAACYSCCIAIYTAISTLLNEIVLSYFEHAQEDAGRMGMVMIGVGMVGAIITGFVLDKTHKYKEVAFTIFLLSTVGMVGLIFALEMKIKWMVYLAIAVFGFFLNAYTPAGVEFATEITYPSPASTVTGLLVATSQLLSVVIIIPLEIIIETDHGALSSLIAMAVILFVGTVITLLTPNILNRQAAFSKERNVPFTLVN